MSIAFDSLTIGECYDRPFLARLWGYKGWAALARGVVAPANSHFIVLFITRDKQKNIPQYKDTFDGEVLKMEGEDGHMHDERIVSASSNGDQIHLFYRDRHHTPFTYEGRVVLENYDLGTGATPSRFVFRRLG